VQPFFTQQVKGEVSKVFNAISFSHFLLPCKIRYSSKPERLMHHLDLPCSYRAHVKLYFAAVDC
jgi:hypothetical protein